MATSVTLEKQPKFASSSEADDLARINAILKRALRGKSCAVYLFGSRGGHGEAGF